MFSALTALLLRTGNLIPSCEMNGEGEKLKMRSVAFADFLFLSSWLKSTIFS